MINSASHAFCNQPAVGGPVYWIRNIAYHLPGGSTRLTSGSAGVLFYNNTILSETAAQGTSNVHWRNNLFLGENSAPAIFSVNTFTNYTSSDYNGFRPNPGATTSFQWNSPPCHGDRRRDYCGAGAERRARARDAPVRDARRVQRGDRSRTSTACSSTTTSSSTCRGSTRRIGRTVQKVYKAEDFDFSLKAGSAAVDRGVALPNVTDGFTGGAPDLGALERAVAAPHYGPRSQ